MSAQLLMKFVYPRLFIPLLCVSLLAPACSESEPAQQQPERSTQDGPLPQLTDASASAAEDVGRDAQGSTPAPSPRESCGGGTTAVSRRLEELQVGDLLRRYRLSLPATEAGTQLPILFAFQGGDGGDSPFPQQERFNALVDEERFIMVSPIAALIPPNEGAWQLNTREGYTQDVDFIAAIIDGLSARYCVDPARIYATGYSLGSMFTYELPCQLSERFAAIASFAGTMPLNPTACDPRAPVAIMHIHGQDDWLISYREQWDWKEWDTVGTMRDIPGLIDFWRETYRCQRSEEPPSASGLHTVHSGCDGEVRVELRALRSVEHEWPAQIDERPTAALIWDFLKEFRRD